MTVAQTFWRRSSAAALVALCAGAGINAVAAEAAAVRPGAPHLTRTQRAVLLQATRKFRDIQKAVAAGYQPTEDCVPGMGFHYVHPKLAGDVNIDPTMPEILVYARAADGTLRLAALEYFRADADGDKATAEDRPTLFGRRFDGPMDGHPVPAGRPPMPVHYDLHVWLYRNNPAGELSASNPEIRC